LVASMGAWYQGFLPLLLFSAGMWGIGDFSARE